MEEGIKHKLSQPVVFFFSAFLSQGHPLDEVLCHEQLRDRLGHLLPMWAARNT